MRILVTGATGFIGSRLLARLAVECDALRILRRTTSSLEAVKNIKFEDLVGDITNLKDCMNAVKGCDYVFHVAASVSYWDKLCRQQYDINVNGTKNIVEACLEHKVRRLVHTSSIVAIGCKEDGLADETTNYNLGSLHINYCDTKHLAEVEIQKGVAQGLDAVIVNPAAVFGAGDVRRFRGHLYGGTVWTRLFYFGGGIATVDIDDVVEGHIHAWKKGRTGERYILANENLTFKEISDVVISVLQIREQHLQRIRIPTFIVFVFAYLATAFSKLTGTKPFATIPMAKFTRINLFFLNEKARQELGMVFKPFRESIKSAISWFRRKP